LQKERIADLCERENLDLIEVFNEIDVSGGTPLARRTKGPRPGVELVEASKAEVVVVAYFDRLLRSLAVQVEVVSLSRGGGRRGARD
jgi:hypothetical protein